mgnify:FL=1
MTTTVMLCGVGGQGTILTADILAKTAAQSGLDVKLSEIHGMAQRGGSVTTIVRFGEKVFAPVTDPGEVDALVSFEMLEALRYAHFVKRGGRFFVNSEVIEPLSVAVGTLKLELDPLQKLNELGAELVDASRIAQNVGSPKSANIVLMGALSQALPFEEDVWREVITKRVPPITLAANLEAFDLGAQSVRAQ